MADNPESNYEQLAKQYDPFAVEARWVDTWRDTPYHTNATSDKEPFCIVIPPPNVTGALHLGHAFDNTIIDTLIRYKRMQGYEALFQPGMDHAGISTQVMVERQLAEQGTDRHQLGREEFLKRVWEWKEEYGGKILGQLQRLGVSADWSRTRFTMDAGLSKAVREQFVQLYHQGLIYRGERIVNWDPESQTTLSDLEVDREERPQTLYTLAYPLEDEVEDGAEICIATQRPETIFADQAIAVHPDDPRYSAFVGKKARIPLTERWIPIITDEAVEIDFGTGALKITPAHDPTDFEVGQRHNLAMPSVIDLDANMAGALVPETFRGKDRFEVRPEVIAALKAENYVRNEATHTVALGFSQRTKAAVEPILSTQWFFKMGETAPQVLAGLHEGEMRLHPERYHKVNVAWLEKLRDWNISRQLWWGHQIPAWYDADGNIYIPDADDPHTDPTDKPEYADLNLQQDPDVFDTWFSSNLWPFSTMGWPDTDDPFYEKFYPTSVLVTGYDILFFWVTKMQLAGYGLTGQKPFSDIVLHGLVLDEKGQKMSKSKGNGIDPLELVAEFGADALRFAMSYVSTGGQDIRWDGRRVEMGRNFNNKLWNATRFALMNLDANQLTPAETAPQAEHLADRWILSRMQHAISEISKHLDAFDLGLALRAAYDFVWSEFCDWYLEAAKPTLRAGEQSSKAVLHFTLVSILKLLHPFIPFITAELYQTVTGQADADIGYAHYPQLEHADEEAETAFANLQEAVSAVRALRSEAQLSPNQEVPVHVAGEAAAIITANADVFSSLAKIRLVEEVSGATLKQVLPSLELSLPLEGLLDIAEYKARQEKQLAKHEKQVQVSTKKLANAKFVDNAPAEVVQQERDMLAEAESLIVKIRGTLEQLVG